MTSTRQKRKRPSDKQLPALQEIAESHLYNKLLQSERQLDSILIRKRLDMQEALSKSPRSRNTLRISVANSYNADDGQFVLQVQARLLHPNQQQNLADKQKSSANAFSAHVKHCVIQLGDRETVQWSKSAAGQECDGVEVRRLSRDPVECKILIQLDSSPEKFRLSPELQAVLCVLSDSRSAVIMALWQYIKSQRLQDSQDFRLVHCDDKLKSVFGVEQFPFNTLPDLLHRHLLPLDPIEIPYTIRTDLPQAECSFVVDVEVDVEDVSRAAMFKFINNINSQREYVALDAQLTRIIQQIHIHKIKKDFMYTFAQDPAVFLEKWIASAARDLEVVLGDNRLNAEYQRRSAFYQEEWLPEALSHYLAQH